MKTNFYNSCLRCILFGVFILILTAQRSEAQVIVPSTITSDMVLSANETYYTADSTIMIPSGITLTVNAGVQFRFRDDTGAVIAVFGTLIINGTEDRPVEFLLKNDPANTDTSRWGSLSSNYGTLKLNYVRVSRAHRFVSGYYGAVYLNYCYAEKTYWTS